MARKYSFQDYWDMFWVTGMPEAFGVYRITKDLEERVVDGDGVVMHGDPPTSDEAWPL